MATVGIRVIFILGLLVSCFWGSNVKGVTRSNRCSDHFTGKVISMADLQTPYSLQSISLAKIEIAFDVESTTGDSPTMNVSDTVKIQVLKHGPIKFVSGKSYDVGLNGKWLCSAKIID